MKQIIFILILLNLNLVSAIGTEFIIPYDKPIIINPLYNNTQILIDINNDNITDYKLIINQSETINPQWNIKSGSKIIATKPIILKQITYYKDFSPTKFILKHECLIPDILNHKKEYLLLKGIHTIIKNNKINITNIKEPTIISSNKPFITTNENCINFRSSDIFYTTQTNILIYTKNKTKIEIDYNFDKIIDEIIIVNKTKQLTNLPSGSTLKGNISFFVVEEYEWFQFYNNKIFLQPKTKITNETIIPFFIETHNQITTKLTNITNTIKNNQKDITITSTKWIFGENLGGFSKSSDWIDYKTITTTTQNLLNPQIFHSFFVNKKNKIIRLFNPTKTKTYNNISLEIKENNYLIRILNLTNDKIISTINKTKIKNLLPQTYLEIVWNNTKINNYTIKIK